VRLLGGEAHARGAVPESSHSRVPLHVALTATVPRGALLRHDVYLRGPDVVAALHG
jgi:hypothetical protein